MDIAQKYGETRARTVTICAPLKTEDYVVQPVEFVSPPKWHLGHTTWFFETFVLKPNAKGYREFNPMYNFVFNSYYETVGARVIRTDRGNLSRPSVEEIYDYRRHVDTAMAGLLNGIVTDDIRHLVTLGLNHEEQHQELLLTDLKYILGNNPLFPFYHTEPAIQAAAPANEMIAIAGGNYEIGHDGNGFCYDNELGRHKVYLHDFAIAKDVVTNGDYMAFIDAGGYKDHNYWHAEGLEWIKTNNVAAPMYWHHIDGAWQHYTLHGLVPVDEHAPLCHISFYEAAAFAAWKQLRLPTEFEWEAAAEKLNYGKRWEWTSSAYLPYPGYKKADGALGEYNGKFMVNQMVLRGASEATPPGHSRPTYRNFFHPHLRWQYTGLRLAA
ncbi:MAG: ergothioneine biosynthesis protein EgtB [Bacteroidota bacterium]